MFYAVEGGGHIWPGSFQSPPEAIFVKTTRNLQASQAMWDHFKQHRRD